MGLNLNQHLIKITEIWAVLQWHKNYRRPMEALPREKRQPPELNF